MTAVSHRPEDAATRSQRLPMAALLILASAGFITILTEALPAGLLLQMSAGLDVSEPLVGQLVTLYAVGSLLAAIPLTTATQGMRRKPLLLLAIGGFAVVNTVTAVSSSYALTLIARFFAGVFAGVLWALIAGYAARMVPEHLRGRAITVAMVGTPLALSLGIPAGALLGSLAGWRLTFAIMSMLTVLLIGWAWIRLPDFAGQTAENRLSLARVLAAPGIRPVLFVTLAFVLAHNILYTYIAPFLGLAGLGEQVGSMLFAFGAASLFGIWIVGIFIDRHLRELVLATIVLFLLAALAVSLAGTTPVVVIIATGVWGLSFGGAATLLQTALDRAAGSAADVAQSMLVTVWNIAIAGGGLAGGLILDLSGAAALPWFIVALLLPALLTSLQAKKSGFPPSVRG